MADKQKPRSENEIEADLSATRDRLARTVDELTFRVSPQEVKRRQVEKLRVKSDELAFDDDGEPRLDRLAIVLGGASAALMLVGTARRALHKR